MALLEPKLSVNTTRIRAYFYDVAVGLTVIFVYGILWLLLGIFAYHLYLWLI